jgi:hypothetical protein
MNWPLSQSIREYILQGYCVKNIAVFLPFIFSSRICWIINPYNTNSSYSLRPRIRNQHVPPKRRQDWTFPRRALVLQCYLSLKWAWSLSYVIEKTSGSPLFLHWSLSSIFVSFLALFAYVFASCNYGSRSDAHMCIQLGLIQVDNTSKPACNNTLRLQRRILGLCVFCVHLHYKYINYKGSSRLGCGAVQSGRSLLTYRRNVLPAASGLVSK